MLENIRVGNNESNVLVVSATSGYGDENWDKIIKLCDRIRDSYGSTAMSSALGSVMKRMKTSDASVQQQAVTVSYAHCTVPSLCVYVCSSSNAVSQWQRMLMYLWSRLLYQIFRSSTTDPVGQFLSNPLFSLYSIL